MMITEEELSDEEMCYTEIPMDIDSDMDEPIDELMQKYYEIKKGHEEDVAKE